MPTPKPLSLIRDLLFELGWTREDIRHQIGEEFGDYEELDTDLSTELISALIEAKRS